MVLNGLLRTAQVLWNLFAIYVCYLLVVAIHEGGHCIAARSCSFSVSEFRVGMIRWLKTSGWGIAWGRKFVFSGWVRSQPTKMTRTLRQRYLTFVLAGPFASIAAGIVVLILSRAETKIDGLAKAVALGSLLLGSVNLLPLTSGKLRSDGLQAFEILSSSGFRKVQFSASFLESKDEVLRSLHSGDFLKAKGIAEAVLIYSEGIPESDKMLIALRKVIHVANLPHSAERTKLIESA